MRQLASQTAARKLGQILVLLVLPIFVLWIIFFQQAKSGIDQLSLEQQGVALARLTVPLLQTPQGAVDETLMAEVQNAEAAIGLPPEAGMAAVLTKAKANRTQYFKAIDRYVSNIALAANLTVDSDHVSRALADTYFSELYGHLAKVALLMEHEKLMVGGQAQPLLNDPMVLLAAGETQSSLQRLKDTLKPASPGLKQKSGQPTLLAPFDAVDQKLGVVASQFGTFALSAVERQAAWKDFKTDAEHVLNIDGAVVAEQLLGELGLRLEKRIGGLWTNLIALTAAGFACSAAALALAVMMMRSTLVKLDELENARREAQEARQEAESMSRNLATINNDISLLNNDLAAKVKALSDIQEELVKKGRMEQLGQLTATIAHEIRNPLGAIRTSAFLLERKLAGKDFGAEGMMQRINNGVNRCDSIISQLLDFSRTKEINAQSSNLDAWLARVVREEAQRLPEDVMIECSLGLNDVDVAFDPARLERAIINLLNNAVEAMTTPADGGTKRATPNPCVWVSSFRSGPDICIRVSDNGPGMSPEIIEKVREPLFTTKSFGTGLGIPAVEQIAKQHGGRLEITSAAGKGCMVKILIPAHPEKKAVA